MTLTSNQKETLHALVINQCTGLLARPIPSLIKRGLVLEERTTFQGAMFNVPSVRYRLTPLGMSTYRKMRTQWHEDRLSKLLADFERDIARAESLTQSEGSPDGS